MALRIELEGDKPGSARLSVRRWTGSADVEMMIQRNQDNNYLSGVNQWGPEKCWHSVPNLVVNGDKLEGLVGDWLVDSLVSQVGNIRFMIQVRQQDKPDIIDGGAVNIAPEVLASHALDRAAESRPILGGIDDALESPVPQVSDAAEPEMPDQAPMEAPAPVDASMPAEVTPISEPATRSKKPLLILLLTALLLLAALTYYLFMPASSSAPRPSSAATTSTVIQSACSLPNAGQDEIQFIQRCLQSKPEASQLLALIAEAKTAEKCNIAQRLYANQSQQNGVIAATYAKEYDEKFYQPNRCFSIDKETAIYWYETALELDPTSSLASTRLSELKP